MTCSNYVYISVNQVCSSYTSSERSVFVCNRKYGGVSIMNWTTENSDGQRGCAIFLNLYKRE